MEQAIIEVLKQAGVYEFARQKVSSDAELVELFQNDFEKLIEKVGG